MTDRRERDKKCKAASEALAIRPSTTAATAMPGDETRQQVHEGSDSESEDEEVADVLPHIDIDPSTLSPLSPEVISKQVRNSHP